MVHTDVSGATGTSYPNQPYRAATNLESKAALCATNVLPRNNSASVPATSGKVGAPSTSAALMPWMSCRPRSRPGFRRVSQVSSTSPSGETSTTPSSTIRTPEMGAIVRLRQGCLMA